MVSRRAEVITPSLSFRKRDGTRHWCRRTVYIEVQVPSKDALSSTCHLGYVESLILGPNFGTYLFEVSTEAVDWSAGKLTSCGAWSVVSRSFR